MKDNNSNFKYVFDQWVLVFSKQRKYVEEEIRAG